MTVVVGFLLGQPPSAESLLPEVVARLRRAGATVWVCSTAVPLPVDLRRAGAVGLRGLDGHGLSLAGRMEAAGVRCCNTVAATRQASDKGEVVAVLAAAGLPVPRGVVVPSWAEARQASSEGAVVAKALAGRGGTGVVVADRHGLPVEAPFAGPYLVQERLTHTGPDRKVFVVGPHTWGVLRRWPPTDLADKLGRPFTPTADEAAVAAAVGVALGLEVYGVDLVPTADGPVVVDVNPFPGFKGVGAATGALAAHLLALARSEAGS